MSKIRIVSTKGKRFYELESTIETWGGMKDFLVSNDIEISGMKAILGETRATLELDDALMPTELEEYTIFLNPQKVQSGAYGYKEAKSMIKQFIADNEEAARAHFGNYTHCTTVQLNELINSYGKKRAKLKAKPEKVEKVKKSKKAKKSKEVSEPVEKLIEIVDEIPESQDIPEAPLTVIDKLNKCKEYIDEAIAELMEKGVVIPRNLHEVPKDLDGLLKMLGDINHALGN